MFAVTFIFLGLVFVANSNRSRRDCRYEFNVWTPNENEQRRLERIELQFDNATNYVDKQLARFQLLRAQDVSDFRNWTYLQERSLAELKSDQLQKYTELQELKIKFGLFEMSVDRLRMSFENSLPHAPRDKSEAKNRKDRMVPNHDSQADTPRHHMVETLKQLVADLKAEWILLKRDFITMKKDTSELRRHQTGVQDSTKNTDKKLNHFESTLINIQTASSKLVANMSNVLMEIGKTNKNLSELRLAQERLLSEVQSQEKGLTSLQASSIDMRRGLVDLQTSYQNIGKIRSTNEILLGSKELSIDNDYPKGKRKHVLFNKYCPTMSTRISLLTIVASLIIYLLHYNIICFTIYN